MEPKTILIAGAVGLIAWWMLSDSTPAQASLPAPASAPTLEAPTSKSDSDAGNRRRTLAVASRPHMNKPADSAKTLERINAEVAEPAPAPVHGAVAKEPGSRHEPLKASSDTEWPDFE